MFQSFFPFYEQKNIKVFQIPDLKIPIVCLIHVTNNAKLFHLFLPYKSDRICNVTDYNVHWFPAFSKVFWNLYEYMESQYQTRLRLPF